MFVYLSKKIAIPHGVNLRCVTWNKEEGYLAVGGDPLPRQALLDPSGEEDDQSYSLLKVRSWRRLPAPLRARDPDSFLDHRPQVIRIENGPANQGGAPQGSLTMNQTLDGHKDSVICAVGHFRSPSRAEPPLIPLLRFPASIPQAWNEAHRKLTTSDRSGLIIVWMMYNNAWVEEMINNRKSSVVRDMRWAPDGSKICIAYEDGAVIVGSVDGSRLWGRELGIRLALVEWSPEGRLILFASPGGTVHIYDQNGEQISRLPLPCAQGLGGSFEIASLDWYPGSRGRPEQGAPCLAVALDVGVMQLMRDETDEQAIVVDTGMQIQQCRWSPEGGFLAVSGTLQGSLAVQFYNHRGQHLQALKLPGTILSGISWDGSGTRLAIGVDASIYFAGIRLPYHWASISGSTVVYSFTRPDRPEHCVMFWDSKLQDRHIKYVKGLRMVAGGGDHCTLLTTSDDPQQFSAILCNAIGSPVAIRQ